MSARQWKSRLEECQLKLSDALVVASEWKTVADNRLTLVRRIDSTLSHNLEDLIKVGDVFGVSVSLPDEVWTPNEAMDAGAITMYIMGKLEAVAEYQRDLLFAASSIQLTLNDTYDLACQAAVIARPLQDLTIPSDTEKVSEPSSPYREYETAVNNVPAPSPKEVSLPTTTVVTRPKKDTIPAMSGALSLFK